ncbi:MAG: hypothetical protein N3G21_08235 [Candidatus Hydrogenedentes bacterium]|nr:hypothetical protein [Candidatus Hydrogenedentota bacterium]
MKRCYFVIKDMKKFPQEEGFIVYAESIVDLINVLQDKFSQLDSNEGDSDFPDVNEGMVIDLGEALEIPESISNSGFEALPKNIPSVLEKISSIKFKDYFN